MRRMMITLTTCCCALLAIIACSPDSTDPVSTGSEWHDVEIFAKGGGGGSTTPAVSTASAKYLTSRSATVGGTINTGGTSVIQRGVCYATTTEPTVANAVVVNGSGDGTYECALLGLDANTTYYARAYSVDRKKVVKYGNEVSCSTKVAYGTVTDVDGNVYNTVTIGDQVWTMENLHTTTFSDGSAIPEVTDAADWATITYGAYCNINNDANTVDTYGRLYNFYAVSDARDLAPDGWHVATMQEWSTLASYLGGQSDAGGRIKSTGTTLWNSPNYGATNAASFFAVPAGYRWANPNGVNGPASGFTGPGVPAHWWTSSYEYSGSQYWPRSWEVQYANASLVSRGDDGGERRWGRSVRLIKD